MKRRSYGRDTGLTLRMLLTGGLLGLLYVVFAVVLFQVLNVGLAPMIVRFRGDGVLWSLDHRRMLTVCFCCPCHCLMNGAAGALPPARGITGLPGVRVSLSPDKCRGCGRCAAVCMAGALRVAGGRAWVDRAKCVACGRCAAACAAGALRMDAGGADAAPILREYGGGTAG
jgi:ferredoxin